MSILNYFRKNSSASEAKERLQIIISHERKNKEQDYIMQMREDIINVIKKYISVEEQQVSVNVGQCKNNNHISVLELNVTLPKAELRQQS